MGFGDEMEIWPKVVKKFYVLFPSKFILSPFSKGKISLS
jgi:hypothetical protein